MAQPNESLWSNVEALHRLAGPRESSRTARIRSARRAAFRRTRFRLSITGRSSAIHAVEAPMTLASGDFCDTFLIAPETLAIVVADVSGKGVAAAMVRGVARSVIRNISPDCPSPGELLTRLDQILTEAELGSMFLTLFVAWYDTRTGVVRYANAGHPVPFRITSRGEVVPFGEVTGSILGILAREPYRDGEERLGVGERLVLYTDGVTEAANADEDAFGTLRLVNLLTGQRGRADRRPLPQRRRARAALRGRDQTGRRLTGRSGATSLTGGSVV